MKLKAIVKGDLINGLVVGLALHWVVLALLYERVYSFEWPGVVGTPISILAVIALVVGLLSIGPHAVLLSRKSVQTKKQGLLVGAGAGVVVGLMVYLAIGTLVGTLSLGPVQLIVYLAEPERLGGMELFDVLQPVVSRAIAGTYLLIIAHLLIGGMVGSVEGLVFMLARAWMLSRRAGPTGKSEAKTGG